MTVSTHSGDDDFPASVRMHVELCDLLRELVAVNEKALEALERIRVDVDSLASDVEELRKDYESVNA